MRAADCSNSRKLCGSVEFLTAPHYSQCSREAVADQRVDAYDVGRCEPTGDADHGLELIKSSAASLTSLKVPVDAPSLSFVHLAVEVLG
jgi:hypothetical protein